MDEARQTEAKTRVHPRRWQWLPLAFLAVAYPVTLPAAPDVVASIGPLRALAAAVMGDLGTPGQIVRGYGSPHAYQMRPSDAARLRDADLVIWVGPTMETFLRRPMDAAATREGRRVLTMSDLPGLRLLPNRKAGVLGEHEHEHGDDTSGGFDAHIWMSLHNAKVMASAIAETLGALDAENASTYEANLQRFHRQVDALQAEIDSRVAPVRAVPFVVFHDAFQYFEESFGLNAVGTLTVSPDRLPSAKRVKSLRDEIVQSGARCVFREPQFESALVATLLEGTEARTGVLDPLGADIEPGPTAYFELMRSNTDALLECLDPESS